MKTNKRVLILAIILGLVTVFLLNNYINSLKATEEVGPIIVYTDVVLAQVSLPKNTKITEEMLEVVAIPEEALHPDAVKSMEAIVDGVTKAEIVKGEQVLFSKVVTEDVKTDLAYEVPEGMRAITIPVDEITGVANYITQGDKIDVLVTIETVDEEETKEAAQAAAEDEAQAQEIVEEMIKYSIKTFTQLQNIEVLEVGNLQSKVRTNVDPEAPSVEALQPSSITILVSPEQAEVIAFATLNGNFHLTLRNPLDTNKIELDYYGLDNFETYRQR